MMAGNRNGWAPIVSRVAALFVLMASLSIASATKAEFRVCNKTTGRVGLAIGVKEGPIFITQGWFNLKPNSCETPIREDLKSGPYYIYGVDYDRGGEWSGAELLCVGDREFYVEGSADCYARGYERAGFRAVNTNAQKTWTLDITDDPTALPALAKPETSTAAPPAPSVAPAPGKTNPKAGAKTNP